MKPLNLISFFLLLLFSCRVQKPDAETKLPVPFLLQAEQSLVYRASFDYKEYHFSGLCVFKEIESGNFRVVFLNEMGITFMDFELAPEELIIHKMIEQFDKKILLNFIENDFRQLLMTDLLDPGRIKFKNPEEFKVKNHLKAIYYKKPEENIIINSIRTGFLGTKGATIKYKYEKSDIPKEILLTHRKVKMNLKLTLLEKI